ncbi:MAG: 2-oxoacid:acceptor oxidoreductase subunit alpha [Planctomycetota bacterium]|jgi:2-oxoglutarate ferredoxin oxidoreductase subunit alpha
MIKADPLGVLTGEHYLDGDEACAEGALAAGCRFLAGYPITPSTEVAERMAARFPFVGGTFIQMEDELASMAAVVGGSWTGTKSMTVTSGPGFSLMMENIGLGAMMETPLVVVNVQRGGPSTGLPTMPGQQDMMQARWGSHGDYEVIAVAPDSPQEAFDLTIEAFNLSEQYRTPVFVMMDECVGHMTEKVVIPEADQIDVEPRYMYEGDPKEYLPYKINGDDRMIPPMLHAGQGARFHTTGLTHDERGYPDMSPACQDVLVKRLVAKIRENADDIVHIEEEETEGAEVLVLSYGISSRVATRAISIARDKGIKVGHLVMKIVWPFPEKRVRELAEKVKGLVMVEMNLGQMVYEAERVVAGRCAVHLAGHAGGTVHEPETIAAMIEEAAR